MKRILVLISLAFLILSSFQINYATTASPKTKVFVDPEISRERPGGTFTININVTDVTNLAGFFLNISWDASILKWVGTEYGGFLGQEVIWYTNTSFVENGTLLVICIKNSSTPESPPQGVTGNGSLANIIFVVKKWGETLIEFKEVYLGSSDPDEGIVLIEDFETVPGNFTNLEGPPVASFTYSPLRPNIGQTVSFDASASYDFGGSISSYTWDFGDGTPQVTENDPVTTHVFLTAKKYDVTLKVTDDVGESGVYTKELTVFAPRTIFVNAKNMGDPEENGSLEHPFDKIQEGVNAAGWGDTVQVASGTYYEHVTISAGKLALVGEDRSNTIIDGSKTGNAITVSTSEVSISDFTIQNGEAGIYLIDSTGVTIHDNTILNNDVGIDLRSSNKSEIAYNNVTSNTNKGISLNSSHYSTVISNIISNNGAGIVLYNSINNTFFGNTIEYNNNVGVSIVDKDSKLNKFHHNEFTDNAKQAEDEASNIWDDGYPSGGNYWSDYSDLDFCNGPYQNESGGDGIWDKPYQIDDDSQDNYPLTPFWKDTENPTANASRTIRTVNEDTLVTFDGSASKDNIRIVSYVWAFIDVTAKMLKSAKPTCTYIFETPGIYPVILNVTDVGGNRAKDNITITVLDITKPVANAGQNQTVTVGTPVTFNASGSSDNVRIISYEWDFGDGTPLVTKNDSVTTHTYTKPGNFTVTLTVRDAAGNFNTAYVVVKVTDVTPIAILVTLLIISIVATVIGGTLAGIALALRRHRSTKALKQP